jgi:hypothetical protein
VRKIILAGTGPAGGEGIVNVTKLTYLDTFKALASFKDPKELLFFTRTANGKSEAKAFVKRLKELPLIGIRPSQCGPSGRNSRQFMRGGLNSRLTCHASSITSWWPTAMTIAWYRRAIRTT